MRVAYTPGSGNARQASVARQLGRTMGIGAAASEQMSPEVAEWWGAEGMYRVTQWHAELRVGGKWVSKGKSADGSDFTVHGTILEFDPPRKVVKTWNYDWEEGSEETTVTYQLEPIEGGTRLRLRHTGFGDRKKACEGHATGWERVLGWLVDYVPSAEGRFA